MQTLRILSLYARLLASASVLLCSAAPVTLDLNQQTTIPSGPVPSPTEAVLRLRLQGGLHSPWVEHGPWHPTHRFHLGLGRPSSSACFGATQGLPTAANNAGVADAVCATGGHGKLPLPGQGSL